MTSETVDRRVLGALRFVDAASGRPVRGGLQIEAAGVVVRPNRGGDLIIWRAPGLENHATAFAAAPAEPPVGSIEIPASVRDSGRRYLSRRFRLGLPRDPAPERTDQPASLFRPQEVALFPSPAASLAGGAGALRVHVSQAGTDRRLAGVLLRVTRNSDGSLLGRGLSDERGEALVPLPDLPATITHEGDDGPVVTSVLEATLRGFYDPDQEAPPDPDDLAARSQELATGELALTLRAGRDVAVSLSISVEDE